MPSKLYACVLILFASSCGAQWTCSVGHTLKSSPADISCSGDAHASCSDDVCCDKDLTTCAGAWAPEVDGQPSVDSVACIDASPSRFPDSTKMGAKHGDDKVANCCTPRAMCSEGLAANVFTCPAGYKLKDDADTVPCLKRVESCHASFCCEPDPDYCSSMDFLSEKLCGAQQKYVDPSMDAVLKGDSAMDTCCKEGATCQDAFNANSSLCPTGYEIKGNAADIKCGDLARGYGPETCIAVCPSSADQADYALEWMSNPNSIYCATDLASGTDKACCTKITSNGGKCSLLPLAKQAQCIVGRYYDSSKFNNDIGEGDDDFKTNCCTEMQTCAGFACPTGYALKSATTTCGRTACAKEACCEPDSNYCSAAAFDCENASKVLDLTKLTTVHQGNKVASCCKDYATCATPPPASDGDIDGQSVEKEVNKAGQTHFPAGVGFAALVAMVA